MHLQTLKANYTSRKKALFSSLLRGPAAEWYENNITMLLPGKMSKQTLSLGSQTDETSFGTEWLSNIVLDGEIRNFLHRIKRTVDKGWSDDLEGILPADHGAERTAQARQRRQQSIDYTLKGLRPRYLQRKAQEYVMENPNATWNEFSTPNNSKTCTSNSLPTS